MKNRDYPLYEVTKPSSVMDMLKQKAEQMPDGSAFRYRKGRDQVETKTYRDVFQETGKAASWISKNYGKGNHIAVIGENSYEWLLAFFAVLGSGNVAVPIDKELPAPEIEWLIHKADVTKVFISKTYSDLTDGIDGLEKCTFKQLQNVAGAEDNGAFTLYEPDPKELACIFFTSGTSGYYPNKSDVCVFDDYHGEYKSLGDPHIGDKSDTSFSSQITCVIKIPDTEQYIALADRWMPQWYVPKMAKAIQSGMERHFKDYKPDTSPKEAAPLPGVLQKHNENTCKFRYVWLPIEWEGEKPVIRWRKEWKVSDVIATSS